MPHQHLTFRAGDNSDALGARFAAIRSELEVEVDFPAEVVEAARQAAAHARLPERDESSVPFFTIDPVGSMDLDQAMCLERDGDGYRVRYAIADVPAFVEPDGPIDAETRRRGQTIYCPDLRAQLHPSELSEGAASLLPGETRPAFVWDMRLDADGRTTSTEVYRALVRSTARLDYDSVQAQVDDGTAPPNVLLLKEIGEKRIACEQARGGASLPMPEQEVEHTESGYAVRFRPPVPAEDWNAQISLMTGMAAAELMIHGQIGILRTMPAPDPGAVKRFRRQAVALGAPWPAEMLYGDFLRTLDRDNPKHLALIHEATSLFRGAAYTPFEGAIPEQPIHAAVADPYAHVTAPLRRLVDRFALVICEALTQGTEVPQWVRQALPEVPKIMATSDKTANAVERTCTDAVEAAQLLGREGDEFDAVVVDEPPRKGDKPSKSVTVQVLEPATLAKANGYAAPGERVRVRLVEATIETSTVLFQVVDGGGHPAAR